MKKKRKKNKRIKHRVIEMIDFLLRPNQTHKSIKIYTRKNKQWKIENE